MVVWGLDSGEWPKATTLLFVPDLQILKGRRLSEKRVNANLKKLAGGSSSEKVRIESCWHHVGFITFFSLLSTKILYTWDSIHHKTKKKGMDVHEVVLEFCYRQNNFFVSSTMQTFHLRRRQLQFYDTSVVLLSHMWMRLSQICCLLLII